MVRSILLELGQLGKKNFNTLYFGGGTPSALSYLNTEMLFSEMSKLIDFSSLKECTFEVNPEDVTEEYLLLLKKCGVNRLSLGVQSFQAEELKFMNRNHDVDHVLKSISLIKEMNFDSYSIDLIYGVPGSTQESFQDNLDKIVSLEIPHISCYALTIEEKTALANWIRKGKIAPLDEDMAAQQFDWVSSYLKKMGYHHYELSNFAITEHKSLHNSNYWYGDSYFGIGPSAHSYDAKKGKRFWNIAINSTYMDSVENGAVMKEEEVLSQFDKINEYIMVRLRTSEGLDFSEFKSLFGKSHLERLVRNIDDLELKKVLFERSHNRFKLTLSGWWISDSIISDLFFY